MRGRRLSSAATTPRGCCGGPITRWPRPAVPGRTRPPRWPAPARRPARAAERRRLRGGSVAAGARRGDPGGGRARRPGGGACTERAEAVLACGRLAEARPLFRQAAARGRGRAGPAVLARAGIGPGRRLAGGAPGRRRRRAGGALQRRALAALPPGGRRCCARGWPFAWPRRRPTAGGPWRRCSRRSRPPGATGDAHALAEALSLYHNAWSPPSHTWLRSTWPTSDPAPPRPPATACASPAGPVLATADLFLLGDPAASAALAELRVRADALRCRSILFIVRTMEVMLAIRAGRLERPNRRPGRVWPWAPRSGTWTRWRTTARTVRHPVLPGARGRAGGRGRGHGPSALPDPRAGLRRRRGACSPCARDGERAPRARSRSWPVRASPPSRRPAPGSSPCWPFRDGAALGTAVAQAVVRRAPAVRRAAGDGLGGGRLLRVRPAQSSGSPPSPWGSSIWPWTTWPRRWRRTSGSATGRPPSRPGPSWRWPAFAGPARGSPRRGYAFLAAGRGRGHGHGRPGRPLGRTAGARHTRPRATGERRAAYLNPCRGPLARVPRRRGRDRSRSLRQCATSPNWLAVPGHAFPALTLVTQGSAQPEAQRTGRVMTAERWPRSGTASAPSAEAGAHTRRRGGAHRPHAELTRATGLGGRARSFADAQERAASRSRRRSSGPREDRVANPAVGRHPAARIETGLVCRDPASADPR